MKGFQDLELPPHFKDMKLPNKPNQNQKAVKFHISDEEDLSDFDDDFFDDDEYDEYHPPLNKIKKPIMGNGGRPGMMPNNMMMMNGNHPRLMNAQNAAPNAAQNDKKGGNNNNNNNQPKGGGGGQQPNPQQQLLQQLQQMKGFQELKLPPHFKDLKLPNMPIQNQNQKAVKFSNPDDDEDFSGFDDDEFDDESDDEDDEYHPPPNKMKPITGNVGPPRMTPNNMMKMMNGNHPQLMNAQNGAPNAAQNDKKGGNNNNNNNQPKGGGGGQQQNPQQQLLQQLQQMKRFQDLKLPPLFKDMKLPNHPPPNKMKPIPGNVGPPRMTPNNMMTMMNGNHPQLTNAQNCAPNAAQNAKKGSSNTSNNNQPKGGGGGQQPNPQQQLLQQLQQMKGFQELKLPPHFKDLKLPNMPIQNQNQKAVKFSNPDDDEDFSGFDDDEFDDESDDEDDEYHPPPNKMKPITGNVGPPRMTPNNMMKMMNGNHPQLMNAQNGAPNAAQNDKKGGNNNNNNNQPKGGGGGQQQNPQQQLLQQLQQMKRFQDLKLPPLFKDMKLPNHPPPNKMKPIPGNVGPPRMTPNNMMTMMNGNHPQLTNAQNCAPNAAQNAKKGSSNTSNNNQPKGGGGGQQPNPQQQLLQQLQQMKGFQELKLPPHFKDLKLPNMPIQNQNQKAVKFSNPDDDEDFSGFDDDEFDDESDDEDDEYHPPPNKMKPITGNVGPPRMTPNNMMKMMNGNHPQLMNAQNGAPNAAQNDKKGGNNNNNNNQPKGGGGGQQQNPQQQLLQQLQQMKRFQDLKLPPLFKDMKLPNHPPPNKMKPIPGNVGPPRMTPNNMMTMMNGNHPQLTNAQNCAPNAAQNAKKGSSNTSNNNQPKGGGGGQQPNPQQQLLQQLQQMKGFQELKLPPHFKDLKLPNMPIQNQNQKAVKFSNPDDDEDFSGFDDDEFDDESDDEDDEYHPPPNKMKPITGNVGPPRMTPNNMMKMMNGNHPQLMNAQNGAPNAAQNDKKGGNNNNNNNQPKGGGGGQQQNPQQQLLQKLQQMKRFQDLKLPPLFKDMKLPNHPPPNKMKPIPGNVGPPRMTPNNMMTMMNGNHPQLTNAQNCAPNAAQNAKKGSSNTSNNNQPKGGGGGQQPNPQQQLQQMKGFQELKLPPHFKDLKLPNMPNQNQKAVKFNIPNDDEDFSGLDDDDDEYDEPLPPPNKMKPIMDNGGPPGMMPNNMMMMMMMMKGNHPQLMNARNCAPNVAQNAKKVGNNNNQPKGGGGGQQPNPQKQQLQQLQQMEGFQDRKLPPHFKDMKLPNMPNQNQRAVKFNISDDDGTSSDFDDDFFDDDEYDEHHPPLNKMKPIMGNVGPPRMTPNNMMKMMNGNHPQLMNAQNCAPNAAQNAKKGGNNNNNQPKGGGGGQQQNPQQQLQQMKGFQDLKLPPHFNDMKLPNVLNQNHKAFKFNISDDDEDISDFDDEFSDDDEYDEHHPPLNEMKPIMGSGGPPGKMPNNIMMNGNRPQLLLHGFGDDDLRSTFSPAACQVNEQYQWQNIKVYQLLGKHKKRSLAVFYLVLEAASFLLDLYGKSERALLLAAFLLSAFGFAMCMYTCIMGRSRGSTSVQIQKQLVRTVEIVFSVVQLIVTLVYFILAEIHVKNNFSVSVFPLLFAVIIAVFTFKNDGGASDSSGHEDDDLFGDPPV